MPLYEGSRKLRLVVLLIFVLLFATAQAASVDTVESGFDAHKPIERNSGEKYPERACTAFYRLDDVTEMTDEIRQCLFLPGRCI
jgi:hypothetical protein